MDRLSVPEISYPDYTNRQLVVVPLIVLAIALAVIGGTWLVVGTPAHLGMDFTGGVELTIETEASQSEIEEAFSRSPESITPVRTEANTYILSFGAADADAELLEELRGEADAAGFGIIQERVISPSFGTETQRQALFGVGVAFLGMSVLVALIFRTVIPSIAIVASAFSDIVIPIALMNLLGIELSLGTVAALLMLIGYSVDSDILLNNQILRRRGDFYESTQRAMRTGVTMTTTSIVAMIVMTIVASFFQIPLLPAVGIVLVFGLCADLMNTYLMNVSLLRYYKYEAIAR